MSEAIRAVDAPVRILDPAAFYPFNFWQESKLIQRGRIPPECFAIHLWHARWQQELMDCDAAYSRWCIYEQLKRRFDALSPVDAARGPTWTYLARRRLQQFQVARAQFKTIVRKCKAALRGSKLLRPASSSRPLSAEA
jgi:hypothetical protein